MNHVFARSGRSINRLPRRFPVALLTLAVGLVSLLLTASRVEATCGDYFAHGSAMGDDHLMTFDRFSHLRVTKRVSDVHNTNGEPRPHRLPCHGLSCQQAPMPLPVAPLVVSFEPKDWWVCTASVEDSSADQASFLLASSETLLLPMIAFRLDRPPKV